MDYLLKGIALVAVLAGFFAPVRAAGAAPLAVKFEADQLQGESAILQMAVGGDGQIIAAGKRVGFYKAGRWEFLEQTRTAEINSLLVDGDSLWVGSTGVISRIKLPLHRDSQVETLVLPELAYAGVVWYLARRGESLIATTKEDVWFVNVPTKRVRRIRLANPRRIVLHRINERLLVTAPNHPPQEVGEGQLRPMENPLFDLSEQSWYAMADDFIVGRGIYRKQEGRYVPWVTLQAEGDRILYTSVVLWGDWLAVVTWNHGLFLVHTVTGQIEQITHPMLLPSPGGTHAVVDRQQRLWVATTRGIALFEPYRTGRILPTREFPISAYQAGGLTINYEDRSEFLPGEGPIQRGSRAYSFAPTSHGPAFGKWNALSVGAMTFKNLGSAVTTIAELPSGRVLASADERVYLADFPTGRADRVATGAPAFSSLAVVGNTVWAATETFELYRSPAKEPLAFAKVADLSKRSPAVVHGLGGTLIVANNDAVTFGGVRERVGGTAGLRSPRLATAADGTVWLLGEQGGHHRLGRLRKTGGAVDWETVEAKGLSGLPGVQHFSAGGGVLTISGGNAVMELETSELKPTYRLEPPTLQFEQGNRLTGDLAVLARPPRTLSADNNSLSFSGSAPSDEFGERPAFERRLLPTETNWVPTETGVKIAYLSLAARDYTLEVRATHLGRTGAVSRQTFTVLLPWYFSKTALGGYVVLAGLLSFVTFRLRTHQIRRKNLELERIVAERTRELAEASAAKTEFVASMSHEIRNPMQGVVGLLDILRGQPMLPRQADYFRRLAHCAEQLRATVDDILDFSKIEARSVVLKESTFDLLDTFEAAVATTDPTGAAITFLDKPPAGVSLRGDAAKLRQIFANYLSNALKYGVPPGARVGTILTPVGEGLRLTLSVTSSGPTIEKDKLDRLFESFTRGDDAIERNIRGTGLGLAICQRYAEAMGGEVGAVSAHGETTFYLNVPFGKVGALAAVETAPANLYPTLPARALAIEDEDYNRIVLGDILAKMNYTVDWATTGAEAIALAQVNGYDIILTDYRLPDTNGVEVTKQILKLCPVPKPAVFAVTAYSTRERKEECLAAGMAGFISKPITLDKLRATLSGWGERQLTTISLETSGRVFRPVERPAAIELRWSELKELIPIDGKHAADLAHRLNNLCRVNQQIDLAEQLELLEGALERGEPTAIFVSAIERLLRA